MKPDIITLLTDGETYTNFEGTKVVFTTPHGSEALERGWPLDVEPAKVFRLDDPVDLRRLAAELEGSP